MWERWCDRLRWLGAGLGGLAMGLAWVVPSRPTSLTPVDHLVLRIGVFGGALTLVSLIRVMERFYPSGLRWLAMLSPVGFFGGGMLYRLSGDPTDWGLAGVITLFWSARCPCLPR